MLKHDAVKDLMRTTTFEDEKMPGDGLMLWSHYVRIAHQEGTSEEMWHRHSDFDGHRIQPGRLVHLRPSVYLPLYDKEDSDHLDAYWMHGEEIEEKSKKLKPGAVLMLLQRNRQKHQDDPNFDDYEDDERYYNYYIAMSVKQTFTVMKIKEGYGPDDGADWIVLQAMDEFGSGKEIWVLPYQTRIVRKGV